MPEIEGGLPSSQNEDSTMETAVQDNTPQHSQAFGHAENADDTRQAQHQAANDVPVDVNPNAIMARTQAAGFTEQQGTFTLMGKNFEASAMRLNALMGHLTGALAGGAKVAP